MELNHSDSHRLRVWSPHSGPPKLIKAISKSAYSNRHLKYCGSYHTCGGNFIILIIYRMATSIWKQCFMFYDWYIMLIDLIFIIFITTAFFWYFRNDRVVSIETLYIFLLRGWSFLYLYLLRKEHLFGNKWPNLGSLSS